MDSIIKKYQTARLDEWIGDYDNADKLYAEIERSEEVLAFFLKETAIQKKREIEDIRKGDQYSLSSGIPMGILYIKDETKCLFNESNLKLKLRKDNDYNCFPSWKYSVSVLSKVAKDLKLEIRGFNPSGMLPDLYIMLPYNLGNWIIKKTDTQPTEDQIDLLGISALSESPEVQIYLSIDRWGLLSGTAIAVDEELGDVLFDINTLLFEISKLCW